jgi:hypothetical protein
MASTGAALDGKAGAETAKPKTVHHTTSKKRVVKHSPKKAHTAKRTTKPKPAAHKTVKHAAPTASAGVRA